MNEEFRETISAMVGYPVDISFKRIIEEEGILHSDVIALMQCKRLDRISDALERVADSLEALTDPAVSGTRHSLHPDRRER